MLGNLQVLRSRTLANAARGVVVRAVARAEVTAVLASVGNGDTAQVGADAKHNQPLRFLQTKSKGVRRAREQSAEPRKRTP